MTEELLKDEEMVNETVETSETSESPIEKLEQEILDLKDKNLRLMAEFDNYKRRTQKEKESAYDFATAKTVENLLIVLDTLELSLKQESSDVESFKKGIEQVVKQFNDAFTKIGVKEIEVETFDPEFHNAVMRDEESDLESGAIVEVFQKGYIIKDKVIRHSMVKVKA